MAKSVKVSVLFLCMAGALWMAAAMASPQGRAPWDEQASKEVAAALHEMHEVWNNGDIQSLKKLIAGDDVLITFELDPVTHEPIRLTSKADLWQFVDGITDDIEDQSAVSLLGEPVLNCRATKNIGICTEECSVTVKLPGGVEERHRLWSTATAVKYEDGWKWIQWHMSTAGPTKIYKNGELVASK